MPSPHIERVSGIGGVYDISGSLPKCIGSCFCIGESTTYVTAEHVVHGKQPEDIFVKPFVGEPKRLERVTAITRKTAADAALLSVAVDNPRIKPFRHVNPFVLHGNEVVSLGFPTDMLSRDSGKETLRLFRGYIQRILQYSPPGRAPYPAYELNFAAPPGLSGAPIFLPEEPMSVVGMVTANFRSYTEIDEIEASTNDGPQTTRTEYRSVITYGIAVVGWHLIQAFPAFEQI